MRSPLLPSFLFLLFAPFLRAEPEFPLTADSQPQPNVPKGTMLKDSYTTKEGSVFPGTQRDYQLYLPAVFDKTQPAAFMVFQDGVIYQAPVVFDNLIAKKDIPPLVGIFIKPGVVPAANDNALPRFNRSYEYDSITPTYSEFLLDEFLPAIEAKHGLKLSTDPNHAAISGNSSGGICAFMAAWHRPDRFRRVFTGVGTYVGIHGADQLPVLVRKFEPKPLRVFLQSGTGDNNLYCGDWWMANQMMERSLTWAGYDVNHAWGEGGHNAKHASQIFPEVMRWLWRDWQTNIAIKANPKGESKWKGYEVVGGGEWKLMKGGIKRQMEPLPAGEMQFGLSSDKNGRVIFQDRGRGYFIALDGAVTDSQQTSQNLLEDMRKVAFGPNETMLISSSYMESDPFIAWLDQAGNTISMEQRAVKDVLVNWQGIPFLISEEHIIWTKRNGEWEGVGLDVVFKAERMVLSPDQTHLFITSPESRYIQAYQLTTDLSLRSKEQFGFLDSPPGQEDVSAGGLCVDTNGWLYVATSLGIQVCDQAGRVNFIIPTPKQPYDVCFGGKDLGELFIACGDTIYKRPTKAKGVVSGQQPPIKPAPPKL
ncbi:MAG TPA: gluconolactonase [Verrucomicrobiales bacterium]|nr:gluconolactonase [Verrucomicrobiales bacterium]